MKRTPLKRSSAPLRRTPLRPVSKRRQKRDSGYSDARLAVFDRAHGRCEAGAEGCTGLMEQVHHVGGRGGADPHRLGNLLGCCAWCHGVIHSRVEESYRRGWMTKRNGVAAA